MAVYRTTASAPIAAPAPQRTLRERHVRERPGHLRRRESLHRGFVRPGQRVPARRSTGRFLVLGRQRRPTGEETCQQRELHESARSRLQRRQSLHRGLVRIRRRLPQHADCRLLHDGFRLPRWQRLHHERALRGRLVRQRPGDCDDGNECTNDSCDPVAGCRNIPVVDGIACGGDGDVCDGVETCQGGAVRRARLRAATMATTARSTGATRSPGARCRPSRGAAIPTRTAPTPRPAPSTSAASRMRA